MEARVPDSGVGILVQKPHSVQLHECGLLHLPVPSDPCPPVHLAEIRPLPSPSIVAHARYMLQ